MKHLQITLKKNAVSGITGCLYHKKETVQVAKALVQITFIPMQIYSCGKYGYIQLTFINMM